MKYRIHFEPNGAYWCIQFLRWECFWKKVKGLYQVPPGMQINEREPKEGEKVFGILQFATYDEAEAYVKDRGIDKAYARQGSSYYKDVAKEEQSIPDEVVVRRLAQIINRDRAEAKEAA